MAVKKDRSFADGGHVGTVYLVGAGPGDPELLTLRGAKLLAEAEVVVYDALVHEELLGLANPRADLVFMGKRAGCTSPTQEEINDRLIALARGGRRVVRLKGGDPFVFGRGGEEVKALSEAGIPCVVIPGVTAGVAVPASLGIPVTHRGTAGSVAFVTGHPGKGKSDPVAWDRLVGAVDTLVIYMGMTRLGDIVKALLAGGAAPETPAAVIAHGTTVAQRYVVATLAELPEAVVREAIPTPAIIVVGKVVAERKTFTTLATVAMPSGVLG
ncbi:MAG: uroporphyrinogen-III C-methyltransferase [Nitrospirae bacterium CG18_big_fil_WC_8_21_14_2_50_70_55]|nr:uroporphyrinogen-III C-methyltransferase [Deltaproteobacteria bacterium]OIP66805.1 MAG: uroporphyrinogen-III C-methyltransferase [Nitrospirae bacterium CG2_30_70_394]PIQ05376.1 MAG: uroporphyrinogen-III C-methyltransferase [Nitrospirae bacterium CG18_big_fil_WC_8_21_14_2_50_70_55]PIU80062.1 MAG: uroporphyrinogen-III C-methyltransferase [Nitrospirae bacterium CG06_land_8_20_14_3_00_70_43]PIX82829.1 MAG: uroporphyrinogen-III C-methyltransferase [Nitrospirae bacterium CG_4_10_14_3_um_filter_70_